jgi:hypothetical protein
VSDPAEQTEAAGPAIAPPAPVARPARNLSLDGLKYVCTALIVLHHVSAIVSGGRLGAFLENAAVTALYAFFAVSGYLHGDVGGRGWAWRWGRFKRLVVPYAFWSCIYLVYDELPGVRAVQAMQFHPNWLGVIFAAGAHGILWFLPALLACAVLADIVIRNATIRRLAIALCFAATAIEVWSRIDQRFFAPWIAVRFPYWLLVYLCGMELRALKPGTLSRAWSWILGIVTLAVMAEAGYLNVKAMFYGVRTFTSAEMLLWLVGALLLVYGAANELWPFLNRFAWGRDYLIGIYLSHVLWLAAFMAIVPAATTRPDVWIACGWVFAFTGASLTTMLLLRSRFTRPVVL